MFSKIRKTWSFHVVVWQRRATKCTKIYNARAQPLSCLLNLLFGDDPVAVDPVAVRGLRKSPNNNLPYTGRSSEEAGN